jgi:platelet-activating factor acetylhydrolase
VRICFDVLYRSDGLDQSFSDFPLLAPSSPTVALSDLETIHGLSDSFLRGRLVDHDAIKGQRPDEGKYEKGPDGKMAGEKGSVVVHLLGKQD